MKHPFDRQVPLDAVRVLFVPLIRSEECLRTKAEARNEVGVDVAQLLRPPRLLRGQEGSAGKSRVGAGIVRDMVWLVLAGVDGLCPQRLRCRQGPGVRGNDHAPRDGNRGIEVGEVNGVVEWRYS